MRQLFSVFLLGVFALALGACHCKTCAVGLPGDACKPCPPKPKPLKGPRCEKECHLPRWPDRPVKCVTTQIARKCCHHECHKTCDGVPYMVEVCEITYKSLYTDGSSKIWTEVSRNPIITTKVGKARGDHLKSAHPPVYSIVGDRCDGGNCVQEKIQHFGKKKYD